MTYIFLFALLLCIAPCMPHPQIQDLTSTQTSENSTQPQNETNPVGPTRSKDRLRQEEEGVGALGEFESIGMNVGSILNGVLKGNLEMIFKGASGFIEEEEARESIGALLQGISQPLTQVLQSGFNYTKQYLGITTPSPLGANGTLSGANRTLQATTPKAVEEDTDTEIPDPPGPPPSPPKGAGEDAEDGSESDVGGTDVRKSLDFQNSTSENRFMDTKFFI